MKNLSTTVATYADSHPAEKDWDALEAAAGSGSIELADAAMVVRNDGVVSTVHRHSHHGWGKGAIAGAVVGLLFPPTLIAGAVTGAAGGAVIARLNRSLDRGDIKDLGEAMDAGEIALVVLTTEESVGALSDLLTGSTRVVTKASSTAEEVQDALGADAGTS
jgi:uncharacterized membrane protein